MFEMADRLVGIYKTKDATKAIGIQPKLLKESIPSPPKSAMTG